MATLVQSASNTAASGTSVTVTLSPTTGGNCLVVCIGGLAGSAPSVSAVTLGGLAGNFALARKQAVASFTDGDCEVWVNPNCAGGQTSVTVTFSASQTDLFAWVMEWSGIASASAADKVNSGSGTSSSFSSGSSGTLANASEVIIGASLAASATGTTSEAGPGSPWTNLAVIQAGSGVLIAGYQAVTASTAQAYSGTVSGGNGVFMSAAVIVSLKLAPPGAGGFPLIPPSPFTPMGWQRQAWPVAPPFTVSSTDTGTGADTATAGPLPGTGQVLIPPGPFSPLAFQRRPAWQPQSLPLRESTDTGAGADAATITVTGTDTGTGADAGLISQEADTGTAAETAAVTAAVPGADTGSGADSAGIGGVQAGDAGSGAEGAGSITVRPLLLVRWSAADKLSKSGGTMA